MLSAGILSQYESDLACVTYDLLYINGHQPTFCLFAICNGRGSIIPMGHFFSFIITLQICYSKLQHTKRGTNLTQLDYSLSTLIGDEPTGRRFVIARQQEVDVKHIYVGPVFSTGL